MIAVCTLNTTVYVRPSGMKFSACTNKVVNTSNNCKILSEYAEDVKKYFTNNTIVVFLGGIHYLSSLLHFNHVHNISFDGNDTWSTIRCKNGGLLFTNSSDICISNIIISSCGTKVTLSNNYSQYTVLSFEYTFNINISRVTVANGTGYGLKMYSCHGNILVQNSVFQNNKGPTKGGNTEFKYGGNAMFKYGVCPRLSKTTNVTIVNSEFTDGKSSEHYWQEFFPRAGGINVFSGCSKLNMVIKQVTARNNRGGNIRLVMRDYPDSNYWKILIVDSWIRNGKGYGGAGLNFFSEFETHKYDSCSEKDKNELTIVNVTFSGNRASNFGGGVMATFHDSDCKSHAISVTNCEFYDNSIKSSGHGMAIKILKTSIPRYYGRSPDHMFNITGTKFYQNTKGKKIIYPTSILEILNIERTYITDTCFTDNVGTAISLRDSSVIFSGKILFENNTAINGGGLKFCESSVMFINKDTTLTFKNNTAHKTGGAIISQQSCLDESSYCFFQPIVHSPSRNVSSLRNKYHMLLEFINNSASIAGDAIYGGNIGKCFTFNRFLEKGGNRSIYFASQSIFETIFDMSAQGDKRSVVASNPNIARFCEPGENFIKYKNLSVIPGKTFQISVVATGQLNGSVPSAITAEIRYKYPKNSAAAIHMDSPKAEPKVCSMFNLTLKVYNKSLEFAYLRFGVQHITERITRDNYAYSNLSVENCPWGFQLSLEGVCDCIDLIKEEGHDCDLQKLTIIKKFQSLSWIGHHQSSINESLCEGNDIFLSKDCGRFEYCNYSVSEFKEEIIDSQCIQGRTGVLCGGCKRNLSLMLGTSRCKPCSNKYVGLIVIYLAAGILLIFILTVFNITVTKGTLYGLIFYANFIHANQVSLFPHFSNWNISRILIAWLNLDLGIEVCLYNGLNAYQKNWLQFGYIAYMWSLQVIIILLCRRYIFFTRVFGKNVTKVLSTLIFLCFSKALQIISDVLEFTILQGRNDKGKYVTKYVMSVDGNIQYLSNKHIPLFVPAILLSVILMAFTFCLLFIQILTNLSNARCLRWVARSQPFFDTFTGPCNQYYAFWPGLMFFCRGSLYILYALKFGYHYMSIIISSITATLIILSFLTPKGVYKKWSLNFLELSYMLNLLLTTTVATYLHPKHNKVLLASFGHVSVCIAILSFAVYHFRSKLSRCGNGMLMKIFTRKRKESESRIITRSELYINGDSKNSERTPLMLSKNTLRFGVALREPLTCD